MDSNRHSKLVEKILKASRVVTDPAGRQVSVLEERPAVELGKAFQCNLGEVYTAALEQTIWPYRYLRNSDSLSCEEQLKLAQARVAVIGSGGLGGTVILLLARMGVGYLTVIDSDVFEETNLNRQVLSRTDNLGCAKAEEAEKTAARINPAVSVRAQRLKVNSHNAAELLDGIEVVVDALDNITDRILLDETAQALGIPLVHGAIAGFDGQLMALGIPLVHGAIAGFDGQLMTVYPGDPGLKRLYGDSSREKNDPTRPEAVLGVPAITPTLVAGLQAMEVIKIILNRGQTLRNRMLHVDLESSRFDVFKF